MKKNNKRLFLFAGYDKDSIINDTLVYYLDALSRLGDIVLVMDCGITDTSKLKPIKHILHVETTRHGEYDFGSYKRAYMWAYDTKILEKYDWVYLVNDSVYGPLWDLQNTLETLESSRSDFVGMVTNQNKYVAVHIQSWFVGITGNVARTSYFYEFMSNIQHQNEKTKIVYKYEIHLTQMLIHHGHRYSVVFENGGEHMYLNPRIALGNGIPFIKKAYINDNSNSLAFIYQYASVDFINRFLNVNSIKDIEQIEQFSKYKYKKSFRLTIFSIPIVTVFRQNAPAFRCYKCYIFDKIPIFKIFSTINKTKD